MRKLWATDTEWGDYGLWTLDGMRTLKLIKTSFYEDTRVYRD